MLRAATSKGFRRPPSDADSRIVRNESQIFETIKRSGEREISDQSRHCRCREKTQTEIIRSKREQHEGQAPIEDEKNELQHQEHRAAIEIEQKRRAGYEQELKRRPDHAQPQRANLAKLH